MTAARKVAAKRQGRLPLKPSTTLDSILKNGSDELLRTFIWDMFSLSSHMGEMRETWAKLAGISGPQWLVLMAVDTLDPGSGVSVTDVADKIHVNSTAVTTQSRALERAGYLHRKPSAKDGRVVLLSLTPHAQRKIDAFASVRQQFYDMIFADITVEEFRRLQLRISDLRGRVERGKRLIQAEIGD